MSPCFYRYYYAFMYSHTLLVQTIALQYNNRRRFVLCVRKKDLYIYFPNYLRNKLPSLSISISIRNK